MGESMAGGGSHSPAGDRRRCRPAHARLSEPQHSEAHLNWALITMMTRRLTRKSPRTSQWTKNHAQ